MDIQNLFSNQSLKKKYDIAVKEYEKCLKNIQYEDKNNE